MRWRLAATGAIGLCVALYRPMPAGAETLRVRGIFAAGARDASFLPTIAVGPVGGAYGEDLGEAIERRLAALGSDGVPHATLVPPGCVPTGC